MKTGPAGRRRYESRLGLYGPFVLLLLAIVAWSLAWLWMRGAVWRRMDDTRASLARAGYGLDWRERNLRGYPFRLDADVSDVRLRGPSGWRVAIPTVAAEAFILTPGHWVLNIPGDITLTRPDGEPVVVRSSVLRASLSDTDARPPRLSVEGLGLTITAPPNANPFFFTAARESHLHTKAGPDDQGAFFLEVDQARAPFLGLLGRIADGKPVTFTADAIWSHAGALSGADWPSSVDAWRRAGGQLNIRTMRLVAGDAVLDARPGVLKVDAEGRLRGSLSVALRAAPRALTALAQTGAISPEAATAAASVVDASRRGPLANVTIDFEAGQTTLGPAAIGPAPKVY